MRHGDNNVIAQGIILWDGITRPEIKDGIAKYSIKIAMTNAQPEVAEVQAICQQALSNDSKFKGTLPPGGCWPLIPVDPAQFEGRLPAHTAFSAKSNRVPQVYDANGRELNSMEFGRQLYPGAVVQVLCHAFSFDNKSKGVAVGLDGIKIIDATAPQLPVGGGIDAGSVFGAGAAAGSTPPPAMPPVAPQGVQPAPDFLRPPVAPPAAHQMTAAAQASYEAYVQAGWSDAQLIAGGLMMA